MEAFGARRSSKKRNAANSERRTKSLNPTPYRTSAEKMRIRRALDDIKEIVTYWLFETKDHQPKWFPYSGSLTDKAEDHYYIAKTFYDESKIDEFGHLEKFHDPKLKASNRITVVTWYTNQLDSHYYVVKVIHSPIPCKVWGWLPLSRKHWNVVILELMNAHQQWQWLHAVREYTDDDSFQPGGIVGWHMEPTKKIYVGDEAPCVGQVIYRHAIQKFLDPSVGT